MDRLEQELLARMSTVLQKFADIDTVNARDCFEMYCAHGVFEELHNKAVADERYRRELADAEAAKELTP